ncbi:MAG TPA: TetR/AcrR family transcriptional regulator [Steroidobacteraceae bacterium]|nr:TetR/AcrR family transcriptional regulator [Steroidobacteraceae bacterium]
MRTKAASYPQSTNPVLVARDGRKTRDALLRVGLHHYKQGGYEATSLRKITEELGITVAATYYHFRSKDELLVAAFKRDLEFLRTAHEKCSADLSVPEQLWTFVQLHTRLQRTDETTAHQPYGAPLLVNSIPVDAAQPLIEIIRSIRDRLRGIIAAGVRNKCFDKVNPTATSYAIFGMSHQINYWYHPGGALDLDRLSIMYADFALRIVGAEAVRNHAQLLKRTSAALLEASAEHG